MSRGGWLTAYNSVCVYVCVVLLGEEEGGRDKKSERERERETALSGGGAGDGEGQVDNAEAQQKERPRQRPSGRATGPGARWVSGVSFERARAPHSLKHAHST